LNVAEYFTLDGEKIRWGRFFRLSGYYAHIVLWSALVLWMMSWLLLLGRNESQAAGFLAATGGTMLVANLIYSTTRYDHLLMPLTVPFPDGVLAPVLGWTFYYILGIGFLCVVVGICWSLALTARRRRAESSQHRRSADSLFAIFLSWFTFAHSDERTRQTFSRLTLPTDETQAQQELRQELVDFPPLNRSGRLAIARVLELVSAVLIIAVFFSQFNVTQDFLSNNNGLVTFVAFVPVFTLCYGSFCLVAMNMPSCQRECIASCRPDITHPLARSAVICTETCLVLLHFAAGVVLLGQCKAGDLAHTVPSVCERNNQAQLDSAGVVAFFLFFNTVLFAWSLIMIWELSVVPVNKPSDQDTILYQSNKQDAAVELESLARPSSAMGQRAQSREVKTSNVEEKL